MTEQLGDRSAVIARELTKFFEEARRGSLSELAAYYTHAGPPKGEIVVVVEPPLPRVVSDEVLDIMLRHELERSTLKEAVAAAARVFRIPRKRAYARALALKGEA
jgi:16S rRNA (cytidine1402-2'-O)-methyltransferase